MRRDELYLRDITESADAIARFTSDVAQARFIDDDLVRSAVLQKLVVIGEAACCVPGVKFVESNFGSFLLADDIARPKLRFGYGGRMKPRTGFGWGVTVDKDKLARFSEESTPQIRL